MNCKFANVIQLIDIQYNIKRPQSNTLHSLPYYSERGKTLVKQRESVARFACEYLKF